MSETRLFEVGSVQSERGLSYQAIGGAAEYLVIAELLRRGHKVAKPVVDDDGVDLVVDYRWRVQVKSGTATDGKCGFLVFHTTSGSRKKGEPYLVDVFVFYDLRESQSSLSRFFVVPTSVMPLSGSLQLGTRYTRYRDAWHVFGGLGLERAA